MATLRESFGAGFAFEEATVSGRSIQNVSLLGKRSKNGHTYTDQALQESTAHLKGAGVFLDHPTKRELRQRSGTRSVRDLTGKVISARVKGDRVRGDVRVLEGEDGDRLLALAEQMPGAAGFSIRGAGEKRRDGDGNVFVESVTDIGGADVVVDPATTDGLFENADGRLQLRDEDPLSNLTERDLREKCPDLVESLTSRNEDLKRRAATLREKIDRTRAKLRERDHRDLVEEKLSEADLPDRVVTETFREQLIAADEGEVDALIEERREVARKIDRIGSASTKDPGPAALQWAYRELF